MNITRPGMGPDESRGITVGAEEAAQYSATANLPKTSSTRSETTSTPTSSFATTTTGASSSSTSGAGNADNTSPTDPANASDDSTANDGKEEGGGGLSPAAMAGIGVGAGVAVIAAAGLWFLCYWRGRRRKAAAVTTHQQQQQMEEEHGRNGGHHDAEMPGNGTFAELSTSSYCAEVEAGTADVKWNGSPPQVSELGAPVESERRYEVDGTSHGGHGWGNRAELA